jgi:hypothetical protein
VNEVGSRKCGPASFRMRKPTHLRQTQHPRGW